MPKRLYDGVDVQGRCKSARTSYTDNRGPISNQATNQYINGDAYFGVQPQTGGKLARIHRWLSAPDPYLNHQKALKQRQAGTGIWFLKSEQYAKWKTDPASFLWLYGIPGCGKTILSSTILESVSQYCADDLGKVVAYFYFDFTDPQKQIAELMIRSLISQLSQRCVEVPATLETLFSSCENRERQSSLDDFLEVLQQIIQGFPQSYIILDALDECTTRAELEIMTGWRLEKLHILVTSRRETDIDSSLEDFADKQHTICLQSELVDKDIHTYIRQRLSKDKNLKKWQKDHEIRQEIETALINGAHGMFRWAACQLDTLGDCCNRLMLRKSLATLPPTLDDTYDRILCAINKNVCEYAVRILQWLAFSTRPLRVEEIAEVVAIDPERDPAFEPQEVLEDPLEVLKICSTLVTIVTTEEVSPIMLKPRSFKVVLLAHYSVKEYLISERCRQARYSMQNAACNEFIAKSCLQYILQFQGSAFFTNENIGEFKLAQYSAEFWTTHVRGAFHKAKTLNRLIMELFSTGNSAYLNWIQIFDPDKPRGSPDVTKQLKNVPTPLYYASLLGLTEIVSLLILKAGADINAQGGSCGNALQAASVRGHEKIVSLLLDKGADVNAKGGNYGNALQAASYKGHKNVVALLLDKGAEVNAQGGSYGNALQAASLGGHEKIVVLLLDEGADVNAQGIYYYGNALQAASLGGHAKIVSLLLDKKADVNAKGGNYGNALQAASVGGHEKVVALLLDKGADVNAQGIYYYGNALQVASLGGHEKIVSLLLDKKADVNAKGGNYGNALQAASVGGHEKVVALLLDKGAAVNAQGGCYGNALQAASVGGHEKVVTLLLGKGAAVNAQGGCYGNALRAASVRGHEKVVALLLGKGTAVDAQGGCYGNALQAASVRDQEKTVALLLDKGIAVNAQDGRCSNALQAASVGGYEKTVALQLDKGAAVDVQGGRYGIALQTASLSQEKVVALLLGKGAAANAQEGTRERAVGDINERPRLLRGDRVSVIGNGLYTSARYERR